MEARNVTLFQVWKVYQRRAESIARYFDARVIYYHYPWEEQSKVLKAASYLRKTFETLFDLFKYKPKLIFIQLPPTPALYVVGIYAQLTRTPYIADCHNAMFLEWWIKWPFAHTFLRKAAAVLVHNIDVLAYAEQRGIRTIVVRDPLPQRGNVVQTQVLQRFSLRTGHYVIVPWNLATDEPLVEFIEAVRSLPNIAFAMTWFSERLPEKLRTDLPDNLILTGYLEVNEFNELFASAGAAISLTIQKGTQPSAAAEAIAFGIPVILSDTDTARLLYKDIPVFVQNEPISIAKGITEVFANLELYRERVTAFRGVLNSELEEEITRLKRAIS